MNRFEPATTPQLFLVPGFEKQTVVVFKCPHLPIFAQNRPIMDRKPDQWPLPASMSIAESPDLLVLTHKWNKWIGYVMLIFCAIWSFGLYSGVFGDLPLAEWASWALLFILPFLAVSVFLLYSAVAYVLNTTTVTIDFEELKIKHAPIPWVNNLAMYRGDIAQVYVKQHVKKSKSGTSYTYSVNAVVQGQKDIALIKVLDTVEEAKFVEQKIEQHLKIKNQKMPGEYRG